VQVAEDGAQQVPVGRCAVLAVAHERGAGTRLDLLQQRVLELPVAVEAQLGDEAGDGGAAHPGPLGEPGHALQPGDGIGGQQRPRDPALGGGQLAEAAPDALAHGHPGLVVHVRTLSDVGRSGEPVTALTIHARLISVAARARHGSTATRCAMSLDDISVGKVGFVERHGLWTDEQEEAARRLKSQIEEKGLDRKSVV
jgi:hypothetical protein